MAKGLIGKSEFRREYTSAQMQVLERLAEIEQEDEDRCKGCGGEDCMCCEYYHDRQKWVEPDELFESEMFDGWHDDDSYYRDDFDEEV